MAAMALQLTKVSALPKPHPIQALPPKSQRISQPRVDNPSFKGLFSRVFFLKCGLNNIEGIFYRRVRYLRFLPGFNLYCVNKSP